MRSVRYYCPTHLLAMALLSVVPAGLGCRPSGSQHDESADRPPPVVTVASVVQRQVVPEYQLVGTVTAIRRSTIGSPVNGRVVEVNVDLGDAVTSFPDATDDSKNASPMVRLDTELVDLEFAAAQAELRRLEQLLKQLKAGNRPEEIARSQALLEVAKTSFELAQARMSRAEQLSQLNSVSEEELETARAAVVESQHRLAAAQAAHELMVAGPREEEIAQAAARVEEQRQEVSRLDVERRRHRIFAPFDAFVSQKLIERGEWLAVGDPVVELVALDPIGVQIQVPERVVHQLRVGDTVPLHIEALPADQQNLEGTIRGIAPSADPQARTFSVRVRVANPQRDDRYLLRDGMQAHAVVSGAPRTALLVPKDAIVLGEATPFVMTARKTKNGTHTAARVDVEVGSPHGEWIEVSAGLKPGQQVIIRGNERLQAGQPVHILESGNDSE